MLVTAPAAVARKHGTLTTPQGVTEDVWLGTAGIEEVARCVPRAIFVSAGSRLETHYAPDSSFAVPVMEVSKGARCSITVMKAARSRFFVVFSMGIEHVPPC